MQGVNGQMPVSVRPRAAPSSLPTEHLASQAERWIPGETTSPAPNAGPSYHYQNNIHQQQQQYPVHRAPSWAGPSQYEHEHHQASMQRHSFNGPLPSANMPPQMPPYQYAQPGPYLAAGPPPSVLAQPPAPPPPLHPAVVNNLADSFGQYSISNNAPRQPVATPLNSTKKGRSYYSNPLEGPPHKLAVTHPDQNMLSAMRETALAQGGDMQRKIAWAKQVLKFIERHQASAGETSRIDDPVLVKWTDEALNHILSSAASPNPVPLALFLRGDLASTGSFPSYRSKDLKTAFRDFEAAANLGYEKAWFRIGRAYEDFGDVKRAVGAYEIGVSKGDCGSTYRMAMAYLLGQISVQADYRKAIQLLYRAADTADLDTPQPPYILGLLLSGDLESPTVQIPKGLVPIDIDEARCRIERSAYLSFGPAQYKMGYAYEYATLGCLHEPLLSVQYYALASQNGEVEADMALSKWYLCGSEGYFEKNERLAYTFAEKAASGNLASAEFALGYFHEVGIHVSIDISQAKRWYARAASHGNSEARERIEALSRSDKNVLSRVDHQEQIDERLIRKRTQALAQSNQRRERSEANQLAASIVGNSSSLAAPPPRGSSSTTNLAPNEQVARSTTTGRRRRDTLRQVEAAASMQYAVPNPGGPSPIAASPSQQYPSRFDSRRPSFPQQQQQYREPSGGYAGPPLSTSQSAPGSGRPSGYQLVDQPSASAMSNKVQRPPPPPSHQQQPQMARPAPSSSSSGAAQRLSGRPANAQPDIPVRKKPETFSEMGIVTTKAKKDECLIM